MALANVTDLDALLQDIAGELPQGDDIRSDRSPTSDYYTIKDARNSARAAERSAMFDDSEVDLIAPWRDVAKTAEKILKGKSKDLEVASWYTEALIRLHGFAGLRDGFLLIQRMIDNYWENLYPEPDEDGLETKVAPLTGLNGDGADGTLLLPIRNADITPEGDFGGFAFVQYQQARDAEKIADPDAKAARNETLGYSLADIEQCLQLASAQWAQDLVETIEEALASYKSINETLRTSCGQDAPPYSSITGLLDEVLRTTRFIYKSHLEAQHAIATAAQEDRIDTEQVAVGSITVAGIQAVSVPSGVINSREDALVLLEKAAKYFRTYEPHTPLAPGLERLIGWGRMTVAELMTELLPDDTSRAIYSQLTGVRLDGSDCQRYVAPPVAHGSAASTGNSEVVNVGEEPGSDGGWGAQSQSETTEAGW